MIQRITLLVSILMLVFSTSLFAQTPADKIEAKTVKTGCSKCIFHSSKKCSLAIEVDGKVYEVKGSSLKDHGKPHANDGLCKVKREAKVTGEIKENTFIAYNFELLPIIINELPLLKEEDSDKL